MQTYIYEGISNETGKEIKGKMEADSEREALKSLDSKDIHIYSITKRKDQNRKSKKKRFKFSGFRSKDNDVIFFTRQISNFLRSGIMLGEALEITSKIVKEGNLKKIVKQVYQKVKSGEEFSKALKRYPKYFSESYTNMVKAGEEGGFLGLTFQRILPTQEKNSEMKTFIISSLIYPVILLIISVVAILIMLTFVLPRFLKIYSNYGEALPKSTRVLLESSNFISEYGLWIGFGLGIIIAICVLFFQTKPGKKKLDKWILSIPGLGNFFMEVAVSRLTKTIGSMLESGVSMLKSLEVGSYVTGNVILQNEMKLIKEKVRKGKNLSDAINESNYLPDILYYMVGSGEKTGKLSEVLIEISDDFDKKIKKSLEFFIKMFEPILILLVGIVVGFIVFSMLLPILEINKIGI